MICAKDGEQMSARYVEILMTTYNGAAYVREQLDSILAQTYSDWHLTVSDDGSSDNTVTIVTEYAQRHPEKIQLLQKTRRFGSPSLHFMSLIAEADADIIALCDQDDVWFPDKLEKMTALYSAQETRYGAQTPILVFSDQTPTNALLSPIAPSMMRLQNQHPESADWRALFFQNVVTGGACLINRALARKAAKCTKTHGIVMHDWWLALVAAKFGVLAYLPESTGYYRQHGSNVFGARDVRSTGYVLSKLGAVKAVRSSILEKKRQADVFRSTYENSLSSEELTFLTIFVKERSGLPFYLENHRVIHGIFRTAGFILLG